MGPRYFPIFKIEKLRSKEGKGLVQDHSYLVVNLKWYQAVLTLNQELGAGEVCMGGSNVALHLGWYTWDGTWALSLEVVTSFLPPNWVHWRGVQAALGSRVYKVKITGCEPDLLGSNPSSNTY